MSLVIISAVSEADAQGRRRGDDNKGPGHSDQRDNRDRNDYNEQRDRNDHRDHDNKPDHHNAYSYNDHRDHHHHAHRPVMRHVHYHDRYCGHRQVVHPHQVRPRYIYYRDYDVYYDLTRRVYVSYSGRSWSVSTAIPVGMRHVNVRTARSYEVDYWNDDIHGYLERGRPACGNEYRGW
jgi:hypothetical protein